MGLRATLSHRAQGAGPLHRKRGACELPVNFVRLSPPRGSPQLKGAPAWRNASRARSRLAQKCPLSIAIYEERQDSPGRSQDSLAGLCEGPATSLNQPSQPHGSGSHPDTPMEGKPRQLPLTPGTDSKSLHTPVDRPTALAAQSGQRPRASRAQSEETPGESRQLGSLDSCVTQDLTRL